MGHLLDNDDDANNDDDDDDDEERVPSVGPTEVVDGNRPWSCTLIGNFCSIPVGIHVMIGKWDIFAGSRCGFCWAGKFPA